MYITILKTYIHTCHNNDIYNAYIKPGMQASKLHHPEVPSHQKKIIFINKTAAII